MKPVPGWPRISSAVVYERGGEAIDWLCKAFGFEVRLRIENDDGTLVHSELTYGDGVIMVSEPKEKFPFMRAPAQAGAANTQSLMMYVDDLDAHLKRARAAGAQIVTEPETHDYGDEYWADRIYEAVDLGGHHWWFSQRMKTGKQ
jgi:uncharacterized glyoxalase superfamily protein PhnB